MKIYFLGTLSGREPNANRKHSSFVIEVNDKLYFFDAGEGCSRTAHLLGLDLLKTNKVIISHTHLDHVGGLSNLMWNVKKISYVEKRKTDVDNIEIYIPNLESYEGVEKILKNTEFAYMSGVEFLAKQVFEGELFNDNNLKVSAYHTTHILKTNDNEPWRSFCFSIECEGKKIVYSGDIRNINEDLDSAIDNGCDILILESGHIKIDAIFDYLKDKKVKKVYLTHCGREIVNNEQESAKKVENLFKGNAVIAYDGLIVKV